MSSIGVYDSGFGGLSVLRALRARLPEADFLYLGDSGRAPYGGRSPDTILDFAEQAVERLFDEGCKLIVVACNTVSCVALRHLQHHYAPDAQGPRRILGVTIPAAELVVASGVRRVGILATARTVASISRARSRSGSHGPSPQVPATNNPSTPSSMAAATCAGLVMST